MARKTQSFSFQKHIENEASSFRVHPFMGLLSWALQLDLHAFRTRESPQFQVVGAQLRVHLFCGQRIGSRNFDFDGDNVRGAEAFRQTSSFGDRYRSSC